MSKRTGKDLICRACGRQFYAPAWRLKKNPKYCSFVCYWSEKHDTPWNKGIKTGVSPNSGSFSGKGSSFSGSINEYKSLHYRIRQLLGNPQSCAHCGSEKNLCWASVENRYTEKEEDWISLCSKCHFEYDNVESRRIKNATRN